MSKGRLFIVSGTSGSGKTIALQVLEDIGFYCIDNLPASLVPEMANRINETKGSTQNIAISIDSRNHDFIGDLKGIFESVRSLKIESQLVFLDADDPTLLKRYSETRRKHPLSDKHTSLAEAISKERALLDQLSKAADLHINTSAMTPHELKSMIQNHAANVGEHTLTLQFQSFGFKYGSPNDADFVFDIRCLPNPHWNPELKPLTGLDAPVANYLSEQPECNQMFSHIRDFIEYWLPHFMNDNRSYITVAVGCTGGQHRSVYLSNRLSHHFADNEIIQTQLRHRELSV